LKAPITLQDYAFGQIHRKKPRVTSDEKKHLHIPYPRYGGKSK
jgi:hypothetical protein